MQVVVAPVRKLPIATVVALVDAGAVCDNRGHEGIAQSGSSDSVHPSMPPPTGTAPPFD
jgi:hypothetical protein